METTRTYRKRYVAFKVHSPRVLQRREMAELLRSISKKAVNITLLTYNPEIMEGILRCDHKSLNMVRSLLNTHFQDLVVTTLLTSGTLKALRNKLPELSIPKRKARIEVLGKVFRDRNID